MAPALLDIDARLETYALGIFSKEIGFLTAARFWAIAICSLARLCALTGYGAT